MIRLNIMKDNSEIVSYNFSHFPVHSTLSSLSLYPNMSAASHWHTDLEFITVQEGHMLYCVNGTDYHIHAGQCILINSRQLHHSHSADGTDCSYHCQLFHPSLLQSNNQVYEDYIEPLCTCSTLPAIVFSPSISWQASIIRKLNHIFQLCADKEDGIELEILSHFYSLMHMIYKKIKPPVHVKQDKRIEILSCMIGHVQKHYSEKITLHDIAAAGHVCRSSCCSIFTDLLQMTPIQYLTGYRLEKSMEMLQNSSYSITEIAMMNGFNSSSYYTEVFHRNLGCTPSEYLTLESVHHA